MLRRKGKLKVRIGIDAGRALHGFGGVATYTRQLVNGLRGSGASSMSTDEIMALTRSEA